MPESKAIVFTRHDGVKFYVMQHAVVSFWPVVDGTAVATVDGSLHRVRGSVLDVCAAMGLTDE